MTVSRYVFHDRESATSEYLEEYRNYTEQVSDNARNAREEPHADK